MQDIKAMMNYASISHFALTNSNEKTFHFGQYLLWSVWLEDSFIPFSLQNYITVNVCITENKNTSVVTNTCQAWQKTSKASDRKNSKGMMATEPIVFLPRRRMLLLNPHSLLHSTQPTRGWWGPQASLRALPLIRWLSTVIWLMQTVAATTQEPKLTTACSQRLASLLCVRLLHRGWCSALS